MKPSQNRIHDAFKAAVEATRTRIRQDRARAPAVLTKLFSVIAARLLDPSLDATRAWIAAGVRNRAQGTAFRAVTGTSVKRYIDARRAKLADILMTTTDLDLYSISQRIGYTHYLTFVAAYKRQRNMRPSDVPRPQLPPTLIYADTSLLAGRAMLGKGTVLRHVKTLRQIHPVAARRLQIGAPPKPEPLMIVDGARDDQLHAEELWRTTRHLLFDEQCWKVRGVLFRSEVLFDLLRRESRLEGRKNRQRGIEVAKLALLSLERSDEVFGERIHELRALGWAWLGNAYRLALDFSAAATAFEQADREWKTPREDQDLSVLAHICCLKGVLRMMRREYAAAIRDLDRSCSLFRQSGEASDEALALIHRAMIHIYSGTSGEAVEDLRVAAGLIAEGEEQELCFAIRGNLANALARAGQAKKAWEELKRAQQLNRTVNALLGTPKLDCIEGDLCVISGDLEAAKDSYQRARQGFRKATEQGYFGVVSVDLMVVHSMQNDWETVSSLAAETLPILSSLTLHSETLATVHLLAQATDTGNFSRRLLDDLQDALRQDPLTDHHEPRRVQDSSPTPA